MCVFQSLSTDDWKSLSWRGGELYAFSSHRPRMTEKLCQCGCFRGTWGRVNCVRFPVIVHGWLKKSVIPALSSIKKFHDLKFTSSPVREWQWEVGPPSSPGSLSCLFTLHLVTVSLDSFKEETTYSSEVSELFHTSFFSDCCCCKWETDAAAVRVAPRRVLLFTFLLARHLSSQATLCCFLSLHSFEKREEMPSFLYS